MTERDIVNFILEIEAERAIMRESGILPDPVEEYHIFKRLQKEYPEQNFNPDKEFKIITHARLALNAHNN